MYLATHVLSVLFRGHPQKSSKPNSRKDQTKSVNHASFVNNLSSVPTVENFHNVAQNLPVGDI